MKKYTILFLLSLSSIILLPSQTWAQCAGNCGGVAPSGCGCDDLCWFWMDCCADVCTSCPGSLGCPTNPIDGACNSDVSICTPGVAGPFDFSYMAGPPTDYAYPDGCDTGVNPENNEYAFITLYITQGGLLNLLIEGNNGQGFLDVVVYKIPAGVAPCTAVLNSNNEIGCNYADFDEGCVQFGNDFSCNSSVPSPNVNAGDVLVIIVNDYSIDGNDNFTLQLGPTGAQTGPPNSAIIPPATTQLCLDGAAIQLNAVNNGGTWSGTGVSASGLFNPATAGIGTHTISYVIGQAPCQSTTATLTLTVVDCNVPCNVSAMTAIPSACSGATNTYSVSATLTFVGAPATGQLIVEDCSGNQTAINPPFISPLTANISNLPSNGNAGCSLHAYFTANTTCEITTNYSAPESCDCSAYPPITATAVVDSVSCFATNDGAINLSITGGINGPFTYAWVPGNYTTQDINNLAAGNYSVTVTDSVGCQFTATYTVHAPANIPINLTDKLICSGDSIIFNPNPTQGITYAWAPASNITPVIAPSPVFQAINQGPGIDSILVTVNATSVGACGRDSFYVFVVPLPPVSLMLPGFDTTYLCANDTIILSNSNISSNYPPVSGYLWNTGAVSNSILVTTPGTFWLEITNNGQCKFRDSLQVVALTHPNPEADSVRYICDNESIVLSAKSYSDTDELLWSTGQTSDSITVNMPGKYSLIITNDCGNDTVTTEVILIPTITPGVLPNIITPNGDGVNDTYEVANLFYYSEYFNVQVFNRWGTKVYDSGNKTISWEPKNISDGVYYMSILYTDCKNEQKKLSHSVTVISN